MQHALLLFQEGLAIYAIAIFGLLVWSVQAGRTYAAPVMVLLASPVLIAGLAIFVEKRPIAGLVDFRHGSWSFLVGDMFVLTTAVVICALAWRDIPRGFYVSWQWILLSAALGTAAGIAFHWWDGKNYVSDGFGLSLNSPTKLAHDFVAYPVLFGGLVCVGVPLLSNWSWHTWAVLGCVVIWVVLVLADILRGLSPLNLHPPWDWDVHAFRRA